MQNNNNNIIYAGFFVRLSAYIIDSIIVGTVLMMIKIPKLIVGLINPNVFLLKPLLFKFSIMDILLYLLSLTYFVLMTYLFGATLGKKLLKIKVCKADGEKLSFVDTLYRESIGRYLSTLIIFIGYIIIGADSQKRGLHDILCDTRVIYDFGVGDKLLTSYDNNLKTNQYYKEQTPVLESADNNDNNIDTTIIDSNEELSFNDSKTDTVIENKPDDK